MADQEKIVFFAAYCPKCRFWETAGGEEPCNTCLANPSNINSHKPVKFVPTVQTENEWPVKTQE